MKRLKNKVKELWQIKRVRISVTLALILLCVILAELLISNAHLMLIDKDSYTTDSVVLCDDRDLKKNKVTRYEFDFPSRGVYAISISSVRDAVFAEPVTVQIKAYSEKRSETLSVMKTTYLSVGTEKLIFLDFKTGENTEITVEFTDVTSYGRVTGITVNPTSNLFRFNFLRAGIILFIALALYLISLFKLNRETLDISKKSHLVCVIVTISICVICVFAYCVIFNGFGSIQYPLSGEVENYDPYTQQLDAFIKGQIHLDCEVDESILKLENPYDHGQREGLSYLWDRAMYDGKYYSYFGIAPILNVYLPHYFTTGTVISGTSVKLIYATLATLFALMTLYAYVIIYKKRVTPSMLALLSVALTVCSGIMLMARSTAHFYYIPVLAGMAYLSQHLFFMLLAINSKHKILRPTFFALAGLSYAMLLLSRVNMALACAFVVLPILYFGVIKNTPSLEMCDNVSIKRTIKEKIIDLCALGGFVLIAIIFTMIYNAIRFDSPFEFGTTYQFTVSDVSKNELDFSSIPQMLYHSFLQPFKASGNFPFFSLQYSNTFNYGDYLYVDSGMGLFAIPLMYALILSVGIFKSKEKSKFAKALCASVLVGTLVVMVLNFYIGGVIYRYTCDVTLLCAFLSVILIISFNESIEKSEANGTILICERMFVVASIFVTLCALCSLHSYLGNVDSNVFVTISQLFE